MARVLVVDDDGDIRRSVADVLESEGYRVAEAENGEEALARMRPDRPDVVLLDLMMPVMDGWAVVTAMKADPALARIPIIVASAARAAPPEGVDGLLPKPFGLEVLLASIANAVGGGSGGRRDRQRPGASAALR